MYAAADIGKRARQELQDLGHDAVENQSFMTKSLNALIPKSLIR
jgi:hypothetical protein